MMEEGDMDSKILDQVIWFIAVPKCKWHEAASSTGFILEAPPSRQTIVNWNQSTYMYNIHI